mmetsp:Transcript_31551/g.92313  ORF Transcript_31551/g.92313 Transcript_31551/m.92313 type:complete len:230 (-) Transcript_31551:18-707(-)
MNPNQSSGTNRWTMALLIWITLLYCCHGWVQLPTTRTMTNQHHLHQKQSMILSSSTTINSSPDTRAMDNNNDNADDEEEEEEEFEYVEYDILTESEFMSSEWLVGTCMDSNPNKIEETWVRLATDKDGKNVAIWGDGSQGTWNFDVANQFLSMSKENFFGKDIWAGVVDDYYYTYGTVRGWNFISPAAVRGQWQAKRLGVDPDEAGTAPWFELSDEDTPTLEASNEEEI